ncbi:sensor histidine kinase [Aromatoleum petrolei]|uniref:histidine kinase n=1 Tax=Aromatoleum petrolei TaxID=76116 RepID=A0ABX1MTY1_9RHOO|nr:ATP-binding protein [Aromatoleum petrolei]NMF91442.1 two-component sensor histidine kinase [Aromatoleum petrolei]QTQ36869.1 Two component system sensor histidine kinase [Aromatoleum petrolei]
MDGSRKPFNLRRWFSIVSLLVTGGAAIVSGAILSHFFVSEAIKRDVMLTTRFIQSIADIELRHGHFGLVHISLGGILDNRMSAEDLGLEEENLSRARQEFFDHLANMPELLLATVFSPDGHVIWSANPLLIGKSFPNHRDLQEVAERKESVAGGHFKSTAGSKVEQQFLRLPEDIYIENYVPLFDREGKVASIVEIYKEPRDLIHSLKRGYLLIWLAALLSAVAIYVCLHWIIVRAARQIDAQQREIVDNKTLVALGEMSSAVAHGLRNPLASIRSSAEVALEIGDPATAKNLNDIVTQVDRLSKWVRELLQFSKPISDEREAVKIDMALDNALSTYEVQIRRAGIEVDWTPDAAPAVEVQANGSLLEQVLNSVLSNAIEAMPRGGRLGVRVEPPARGDVTVKISDTGCGMSEKQLEMVFKPFYTTKRNGLGVGLALVQRIMERFGGTVVLESREQAGTTVSLTFKVAEQE